MTEELLTTHEVAARLKINEQTVRKWLREGRLKGTMMGGTKIGYRVTESEVRRIAGLPPSVNGAKA